MQYAAQKQIHGQTEFFVAFVVKTHAKKQRHTRAHTQKREIDRSKIKDFHNNKPVEMEFAQFQAGQINAIEFS